MGPFRFSPTAPTIAINSNKLAVISGCLPSVDKVELIAWFAAHRGWWGTILLWPQQAMHLYCFSHHMHKQLVGGPPP
jgi:hypothetical protein